MTQSINTSLNRMISAFAARASTAMDTTKTRAVLNDGYRTVTSEGGVQFTTDMPKAAGGIGNDPTPGVLGRACVASCIAMGIRTATEMRGTKIDQITVDISMDWDSRGLFGTNDISAGPSNIVISIDLVSNASPKELQSIVDEGMVNDPWLLALTQPHNVKTDLTVKGS